MDRIVDRIAGWGILLMLVAALILGALTNLLRSDDHE